MRKKRKMTRKMTSCFLKGGRTRLAHALALVQRRIKMRKKGRCRGKCKEKGKRS
jgi:hypothetical protein